MSGDLIAFVNARLDEKAAAAWAVHNVAQCDALLYEEDMPAAAARTPDCDCGYPARALREVEAKREIVRAYEWTAARKADGGGIERNYHFRSGQVNALETAVQCLAAVDSDHPDYRQEWKP